MRLYISADIEGIAGVVSRDTSMPEGFEYERARDWMTGEVAAVCEAAMASGMTEIIVSDSHGNGQNLKLEDLPEDVEVVRSWPRPLEMMQGIESGSFDAAALIGYHAGATNRNGVLAHTFHGRAIAEVRINGQAVSEAGFSAATAGHFGVPVILISGDDVFVEETRGLLGNVECVTTKEAYGTTSARTMTPKAAQKLLAEHTRLAIKRLGDFRPFTFDPPISLEIDFKHRLPAELLDYLPLVERLSAYGIRVNCPDMVEASKFVAFTTSYQPDLI